MELGLHSTEVASHNHCRILHSWSANIEGSTWRQAKATCTWVKTAETALTARDAASTMSAGCGLAELKTECVSVL